MSKDRESVHPVAGSEDVQIFYRRSAERPFEYAILLQVRTADGWQTRVVADNSHEDRNVAEHHWHRYIRGEKLGRKRRDGKGHRLVCEGLDGANL